MTVVPPVPLPVAPSKFKTLAKKVWAGFLTAVTSSAAVKDEKNIAVTVVTGILLSVGATAGLVTLVTQVIQGL